MQTILHISVTSLLLAWLAGACSQTSNTTVKQQPVAADTGSGQPRERTGGAVSQAGDADSDPGVALADAAEMAGELATAEAVPEAARAAADLTLAGTWKGPCVNGTGFNSGRSSQTVGVFGPSTFSINHGVFEHQNCSGAALSLAPIDISSGVLAVGNYEVVGPSPRFPGKTAVKFVLFGAPHAGYHHVQVDNEHLAVSVYPHSSPDDDRAAGQVGTVADMGTWDFWAGN